MTKRYPTTFAFPDCSALPVQQVAIVLDAIDLATAALLGVVNQPRCMDDETFTSTPGGEIIDGLNDWLTGIQENLLAELEATTLSSPEAIRIRGNLTLRHLLQCNGATIAEIKAFADALPDHVEET